ncbi:MAG: SPOCS domain-containing protein [Christensenellales bacterium]|jgi:hypothetical protein
MALERSTQTIEIETGVGARAAQALVRAEALVPGAGRDAIEVLLTNASVELTAPEAQTDRVVVEGTVRCQAVYRQGDETTLRALAAQAPLSQVFDMPGVSAGLTASANAQVEHVEARYENGHMVFLTTVALASRAHKLTPAEVITSVDGGAFETEYLELNSVKTSAESAASTLVREEVALPAALDARTALMEWGAATVESYEADLGGIRVKGKAHVESLIASGVEGRPAAAIKYALDYDQLVELPEWLAQDVRASASLDRLETRVEHGGEGEDSTLVIEAEIGVHVRSIGQDSVSALADSYATGGQAVQVARERIRLCTGVEAVKVTEQVKGALLLSENAPGVGSVIAVVVHPNVSGWTTGEDSRIEGVLEANVIYMPGGSDRIASAQSELPFSIRHQGELNDASEVELQVLSAEANALMSDRVELRCALAVNTLTRFVGDATVVQEISEGEPVTKRPGIVLFWPASGDSAWTIGRRYAVPVEDVLAMNGGSSVIEAGRAMVLKI